MLPKGTIKVLKTDASYYYVKQENLDFAWWKSQCKPNIDDDRKMQVRMTDEMVLKENIFNVFVPLDEYNKLKII